jgi:hypothetical protein
MRINTVAFVNFGELKELPGYTEAANHILHKFYVPGNIGVALVSAYSLHISLYNDPDTVCPEIMNKLKELDNIGCSVNLTMM